MNGLDLKIHNSIKCAHNRTIRWKVKIFKCSHRLCVCASVFSHKMIAARAYRTDNYLPFPNEVCSLQRKVEINFFALVIKKIKNKIGNASHNETETNMGKQMFNKTQFNWRKKNIREKKSIMSLMRILTRVSFHQSFVAF